MKKFTKLFLSCAAVAALSTAIGVSAMAEDTTAQITGDVTGTVTITEAGAATVSGLTIADTPAANTQVTFLVFKGTAGTDVAADTVVGIDQGTEVQPTNAGLKTTGEGAKVVVPAEGAGQDTYTVKVGYYNASNTFTVKSGTFKLGTALGENITLGDVNGDGDANSTDAMAIQFFEVGETGSSQQAGKGLTITSLGDSTVPSDYATATKLGDVNGDTDVNSTDAMAIQFFEVGETGSSQQAGKVVLGTVAQ